MSRRWHDFTPLVEPAITVDVPPGGCSMKVKTSADELDRRALERFLGRPELDPLYDVHGRPRALRFDE